jgi:hypothetical protein
VHSSTTLSNWERAAAQKAFQGSSPLAGKVDRAFGLYAEHSRQPAGRFFHRSYHLESWNTPRRNKRLPIAKNAKPSKTYVLEPPLPKKDSPLLILTMPLTRKATLVKSRRGPTTKAILAMSKSEVSIWSMVELWNR